MRCVICDVEVFEPSKGDRLSLLWHCAYKHDIPHYTKCLVCNKKLAASGTTLHYATHSISEIEKALVLRHMGNI